MAPNRHGSGFRLFYSCPILIVSLFFSLGLVADAARAADEDCSHVPQARDLHVYEYNGMYYLQSPGAMKKFKLPKNHALQWSISSVDEVDSVSVMFKDATPFASPWFGLMPGSPACSGLPAVEEGSTWYVYEIRVYPKIWKGEARIVDPGVIIEGPSNP